MSFLTIPGQEGLFRTIRTGRSDEEAQGRSPEENDDDEEEDDAENVRLIPRCSPVPRKRGQSIIDENAEYIRSHFCIAPGKKVLFADTTGGELVDVKEFVAFDSDDEEASARWEEEEAKYRKPEREPTYSVLPQFLAPSGSALRQAVQARKVEVEQLGPVENEPLAVSGLIRVLNVSFHKSVYIRSTMDGWVTYFDHPAEYVHGSHDGDTDQFSFKLSFAPPYTTHGSRIEFVVRYETADGDYWANNSSVNYAVTLLLSYEDDAAQTTVDTQRIRSILKPPKAYSMQFDTDSEEEPEKEKVSEAESSDAGTARPRPACPVIMEPEIDIEISVCPPGPPVPSRQERPCGDGAPSAHADLPGEAPACTSSQRPPRSSPSSVLCASESLQPSPGHHCGLGGQASARDADSRPAAPLPASTPPPQPEPITRRRDETPRSEASTLLLRSATAQVASGGQPAGDSGPELPAEGVPSLRSTAGVALGQPCEETSESLPESAAHRAGSTSTCWPLLAEPAVPLGAEDQEPPSPGLMETPPGRTGDTEVSQSSARRSASPQEGRENTPQTSPGALIENLPPDVSEARSERDVSRDLVPAAVFLSGVVSLSVVSREPSALFLIGLLLVLCRL